MMMIPRLLVHVVSGECGKPGNLWVIDSKRSQASIGNIYIGLTFTSMIGTFSPMERMTLTIT